MCGIYGTTKSYAEEFIKSKLALIQHRGPDFSSFRSFGSKVTLGHNRLSILDLDPRSHQPFDYHHLSIVFNGEVYNFKEIRDELHKKGYTFQTESDTEVVCAAYLEYGSACLPKFNGMFAFVIFDAKKNLLFGARDRLGQKPFYYYLEDDGFEFASQPGPIKLGNTFHLNEQGICQFLMWKYIPEPNSIYREVKKLKAGHYFIYDLGSKEFQAQQYWDIPYERDNIFEGSYEEAQEKLRSLLENAVSKRMISDVPLGVFLSGGIDSSLIASIAQSKSTHKIRTFSVKFGEEKFDESQYAQAVADHLKTEHTVIPCNYREGIELIDNLQHYYDEPFADSSAIPTMLLAKHTRKHVTVALSGDAGDEMFIGYSRYDRIVELSHVFKLPYMLRYLAAKFFAMSPNRIHRVVRPKGFLAPDISRMYYDRMTTMDTDWILDTSKGDNSQYYEALQTQKPLVERVSDYDIKTYLNDDINTKVDRATMAFSLEARAPLMDVNVVEFARSLPTEYKFSNGVKKRILKDILYKYVPRHIFDRPKAGFSMPLGIWFRTELKDYVRDTLTARTLSHIPNIDVAKVLKLIENHISGKENNFPMIWVLLVLVNWQNANR